MEHRAPTPHTECTLSALSMTPRQTMLPVLRPQDKLATLELGPPQDKSKTAHLSSTVSFFSLPPCPSQNLTKIISALPTPLKVWRPPGLSQPVLPGLKPVAPGESMTYRLSSKTFTAPPSSWGERPGIQACLPPLPQGYPSLVRENVRFPVSVAAAGGRVGGGVIQPPPQECGARRAFPAITRRGRGWRANGFNYHSDRNAGRRAPRSSQPGRAHPGQLVLGTSTSYAALAGVSRGGHTGNDNPAQKRGAKGTAMGDEWGALPWAVVGVALARAVGPGVA